MEEKRRIKAINAMNKFIWGLKGKCDGIAEVNKELIMQYCRFSVLADEVSMTLAKDVDKLDYETLEAEMKKYERFNKTVLSLYKVLKFEQIKDELADFDNPFTKLYKEAEANGDF